MEIICSVSIVAVPVRQDFVLGGAENKLGSISFHNYLVFRFYIVLRFKRVSHLLCATRILIPESYEFQLFVPLYFIRNQKIKSGSYRMTRFMW